MAKTITTLEALQKSATRYEKELLIMPATSAGATLQHMTGMPGLLGNVALGQLDGDAELGPYKSTRSDDGDFTIAPRELELFLGNCAYGFDPNDVWGTIYGSLVAQGESLKTVDVNKYILMFVAGKLGRKLNMAIWNAKRNAEGDTTKDLFNGFDTITDTEATADNIAAGKGNYMELTAAIDKTNAIDTFNAIYAAADDELQGQKAKIYAPSAPKQITTQPQTSKSLKRHPHDKIQNIISQKPQNGVKGILPRHRTERHTYPQRGGQPHSQALNHARRRHQGRALGTGANRGRRPHLRPLRAPGRPRFIQPHMHHHPWRGRPRTRHRQAGEKTACALHSLGRHAAKARHGRCTHTQHDVRQSSHARAIAKTT